MMYMAAKKTTTDDELNDSLDDLLGGAIVPERVRPAPPANYQPTDYTEPCKKCGGTGHWRPGYPCFACKGVGKKTFKSSPQQRAKHREHNAERKLEKVAERKREREAWEAEHAAEVKWLRDAARRNDERNGNFDFPINMINAINQYSSLTENQLATVQRLMLRDQERNEQRTKERQEREANAPTVNVSRIEEAFAKATANKVRYPKLRLDTFVFSPAGANSKNPGAVYVKEGEEYLGKVVQGKFLCTATCGDERRDRVTTAANDPEAAAVAYGKRFGQCSICSRTLTDGDSIDRGIGPICASKYGW
jgi:Family of unknown function (DUF6011)